MAVDIQTTTVSLLRRLILTLQMLQYATDPGLMRVRAT